MSHRRATLKGLDKELDEKRKAKYDKELEKKAIEFIEGLIGECFSPSFAESLKSGIILCKFMNACLKFIPNSKQIKINKMAAPFMQMENIESYISACRTYLKLDDYNLFLTVDLYEEKDLLQVLQNIEAVGRHMQKVPGYDGPKFGAKIATKNKRTFDQEKLIESEKEAAFAFRM